MNSLINHHVMAQWVGKDAPNMFGLWTQSLCWTKNSEYVANQETSKTAIKHAASNSSFSPVLHQLQENSTMDLGSLFANNTLCRAVSFNGKYLRQTTARSMSCSCCKVAIVQWE